MLRRRGPLSLKAQPRPMLWATYKLGDVTVEYVAWEGSISKSVGTPRSNPRTEHCRPTLDDRSRSSESVKPFMHGEAYGLQQLAAHSGGPAESLRT